MQVKVHLGCGPHVLPGWMNYDLQPGTGGLKCDLRRGVPHRDDSVDFVFSEHFLEHLDESSGLRLLKECHRVLKPGGVLRVTVPSLRVLVERYWDGNLIKLPGVWEPPTPAVMINEGMRAWGHEFMYDGNELMRKLAMAGFTTIVNERHRTSKHVELAALEVRPYTTEITMEATK